MTHSTLIFGNGPCAQSAAQYLLEQGRPVILATREAELRVQRPDFAAGGGELEWLGGVRLNACQRDKAECLSLEFLQAKEKIRREVQEIIIAEETASKPCFERYSLTPGEGLMTIGEVWDRLGVESDNRLPWRDGDGVLLLNGVNRESHPLITRRVLEAALKLQGDHGIQTYLLTRNLKVAAAGLERLVHQARQAGVLIIKISVEMPALVQSAEGGLQLTLLDEITGESYTLALRGAVVDEALQPAPYLAELGAVLELESDPDGFLQAENVHRLTCGSNRPAIRVAGPARGILSLEAQMADGRIAAAAAIGLEDRDPYPQVGLAEVVQGRCIRCLTCYRLCPYRAIALNAQERLFVRAAECRKCGICAAECPRGAITLAGLKPGEMARAL
ncbi:MAG: 4Fe-4S binding protein, partial [Desulfobacterales bacterium]